MYERVVFLHPDLGIGGAERLIVDAAVAVNQSGYQVKMITNHYEPTHAFEETQKSEFNVISVADWFPRSVYGRFMALCAYVRLLLAAVYLIFTCNKKTDIIVVDQISAPLPLLNLAGFKTLFYCHFPDLLLTDRSSHLKKMYRILIDYVEERSIGWASKIVVNSKFTAGIFRQTFSSLKNLNLEVLYPVSSAANLHLPAAVFDSKNGQSPIANRQLCRKVLSSIDLPSSAKFVFVSINRYERKKNLQLILFAMNRLVQHWGEYFAGEQAGCATPQDVHVVIAGGYDTRVLENVVYYNELVELAQSLHIAKQVTFVRSCPSEVKNLLIASSDAVLYTPEGEHFGIVPVEAMFLSRPVIALDSGGPRETVRHGITGLLCPPEPKALLPEKIAEQMARFIEDPNLTVRLGGAGYRRANEKFTFNVFQAHLCDILRRMSETSS
ncbi:putative dolichyl-P-Man:GDP-Man1GlcNAc2-PP-dolichyl alpha-1 3-mannosyltransferase [Fasciola hepatica]|uniref:Alpha-1,3/1,6-mannosyltransferase ALG2 n=1 Tax=Fasciola hepatica TaxID=6192 RepID=A0A4E0RLP4_FASHE|nr:putative dolichyl-P-Man:GDP-Man1GlcNAc2-PP-dolichyl alpha-1 3-mannosyltransferase [Fasciola hepatica]